MYKNGGTFFFHHTTCEITCDTLTSPAANQGDNTVSVTQGGTATPGATEQLLPPDRVFKRIIKKGTERDVIGLYVSFEIIPACGR